MRSDLLRHRAGLDLLDQAPAQEDRRLLLRSTRVVLEPVAPAPGVLRPDDLGMVLCVLLAAVVEHEMADHAPGRADVELHEQVQQPVDDDLPLQLTGPPEGLRPEQIEGAPDQLEIEAQREHALLEPHRLSARPCGPHEPGTCSTARGSQPDPPPSNPVVPICEERPALHLGRGAPPSSPGRSTRRAPADTRSLPPRTRAGAGSRCRRPASVWSIPAS